MYKNQKITNLFSPEQFTNSIHLDATFLETTLFINDGTGHFSMKALPSEVQFSPVFAVDIADFDGDGNPDVLLGGNLYNVKPEVGRYDASFGTYLSGDGHGNFKFIPATKTGLRLEGEVRDIMEVKTSTGKILVVARNNDKTQVFKILNH